MNSSRYRSNNYFSQEFPLGISVQRRQADIVPHAHEFMELVIITAGSGMHRVEKDEYPICRGDAFVIQPGHPHGYTQTRSLRLVNILFDLSWFDRLTAEIPKKPGFYSFFQNAPGGAKRQSPVRLHLDNRRFKNVQLLLTKITRQLSSGRGGGDNLSAAGLLLEITGLLSSCYKSSASKSPSLKQADAVMEYIEANHVREISLKMLADIAKVSTRSLLRIFRDATGTTPIDYLLRYRISCACRLLAETDRPVTKIAFDAGFSDGNYFCRQFKKIIGTSPARYRTMRTML